MPDESLDDMVAGRKLRPAPARLVFQRQRLAYAGQAITVAGGVVTTAPAVAFANAYDGIRHCVDAHMNSRQLRVESGEGGHRHRVEYARLAMATIVSVDDLDFYRAARGVRNEVEYPSPESAGQQFSPGAAKNAVAAALRFHQGVRSALGL